MTVKSILIKYLLENKYDGLYCPGDLCSCDIDHLLVECTSCGYEIHECEPGYKLPVSSGCHKTKYQRIVSNPKNYKIREPKFDEY